MFLRPRQYRTPAGDGETLIDPPPGDVPQLLNQAKLFHLPGRTFDGLSLPEWRASARREVLSLISDQSPPLQPSAWFVAGHQPELFHPGVWLKYFVMSQLANKRNAVALNLIVDNDVPKSAAVRVPVWRPGIAAEDVTITHIQFDSPPGDVPYEEWYPRDAELFESFPNRLKAATKEWPFEPIGVPRWNVRERHIVKMLSTIRHDHERKWGLRNLELKVSQLCSTETFVGFVHAIVEDTPRFHECYNSAVRAYRAVNKIKSRHHPVPDLASDGDWLEAPFWCWTSDEPHRQRPFVRQTAQGLRLRWGRHESNWPNSDVKLRPRALTLTLFVRLALADSFIHGIGGGKYDELTDAISTSYFGAAPPAYMIVSGTLRLPFPQFPTRPSDTMTALRRERDVQWNPHRHIAMPELAAERSKLLTMPVETRLQRRERYTALRRNLSRWQSAMASSLLDAQSERVRVDAEQGANAVLGSREHSWALYPEEMLREWLTRGRT
jgi:hypothetical protein